MKIKELEIELFNLNRELDELDTDITTIEEQTVIDVIILAENLSKSKGKNGHELSRSEKRDLEIKKRLKNNHEWNRLISYRADLLRDIEFTRIDIEYLKREFKREFN